MLCLLFRQVQFLGKVVDTPVVFNDRGYGPDSAVPGQVLALPVILTGAVLGVVYNDRGYGPDSAVPGQGYCSACYLYDRCTWFQTCRIRLEVLQMQFCVAGDVPVTMQRLCGVYGDGAIEGFFAVCYCFFRPPHRS